MNVPRHVKLDLRVLVGLALLLSSNSTSVAQQITPNAGVTVDAQGVLRATTVTDETGELTRKRMAEAKAALDPRVAAKSALRKISLNRLEKAIQAELSAGRKPTDEMQYLAGLTRAAICLLLSGYGRPRNRRARRGLGRRSGRPRDRHPIGLARAAIAGSGRGAACLPGERQGSVLGRMLDRRHARGIGPHAEVSPFDRHPSRSEQPGIYAVHRRRAAYQPRVAKSSHRRRLAQDPFCPGHGRSRLPHETHRHRSGDSAGAHRQFCRSGRTGRHQPASHAALVVRAGLSMCPRQRRSPGHGVGRQRGEAVKRRRNGRRRGAPPHDRLDE